MKINPLVLGVCDVLHEAEHLAATDVDCVFEHC
jgi:hypothetical protein